MKRQITGRCHACNVRFTWCPPPKLRDANCPRCGVPLNLTTHYFRGEQSTQAPTGVNGSNKARKAYDEAVKGGEG